MKKSRSNKKQLHPAILDEENAQKQYANNDEFFDFVDRQNEKTFRELTLHIDKDDEEIINRTLVAGLMTLLDYSRQCSEFECVVGLFVESYIAYAKKLSDEKIKREELWKLYYTIGVAKNLKKEGLNRGLLDFLVQRIMFTLNMYLWHDYCKQNNIPVK